MAELSGQMTPVIEVTAFICFCPNAFSIPPVLSNFKGRRPLPLTPMFMMENSRFTQTEGTLLRSSFSWLL